MPGLAVARPSRDVVTTVYVGAVREALAAGFRGGQRSVVRRRMWSTTQALAPARLTGRAARVESTSAMAQRRNGRPSRVGAEDMVGPRRLGGGDDGGRRTRRHVGWCRGALRVRGEVAMLVGRRSAPRPTGSPEEVRERLMTGNDGVSEPARRTRWWVGFTLSGPRPGLHARRADGDGSPPRHRPPAGATRRGCGSNEGWLPI